MKGGYTIPKNLMGGFGLKITLMNFPACLCRTYGQIFHLSGDQAPNVSAIRHRSRSPCWNVSSTLAASRAILYLTHSAVAARQSQPHRSSVVAGSVLI